MNYGACVPSRGCPPFAAGLLGVDRGKISNIESGVRGISADRLRTLACNCDVHDETYIEALVEMAQASTGWWERYRGILPQGLLDIAETESHAVRLRGANTVHVPGVLRASEQAMAIFRAAVPALPERRVPCDSRCVPNVSRWSPATGLSRTSRSSTRPRFECSSAVPTWPVPSWSTCWRCPSGTT